MEAGREEKIRIATEGLRLVLECKVPQFGCLCCVESLEHRQLKQQQREWSKRLPQTLPPLLDWIEQHRQVLFPEKDGPVEAAVQEFQRYFVLVFLEQFNGWLEHGAFQMNYYMENYGELETRLFNFNDNVVRIVTNSAIIRNWLFHYYGNALGIQGWRCRPGDLYSLQRLFECLKQHKLDVLFGQRMLTFLEQIGKELLGFPQNTEYQTMGVLVLFTVMEINYVKQIHTRDAEHILRIALALNRDVSDDYGEELWGIIYYSVASIRAANSSLEDDIMINLLAHLNEALMKKEEDPTVSLGDGPLAYLKAVTLLLLVDLPEVDIKESNLDELTIRGQRCDRDKFRRHVKSCVRTVGNLRISMNIRLRIAKMIPKLFAGFTSVYYVDIHAYNCLELLTWMTMFPASSARQHKNARGIMLKRLVEEMKRLCEDFIKNPSEYSYDEQDLQDLYHSLQPLLSVIREGVQQLPNAGWFRRLKSYMRMISAAVLVMLEMLKLFKMREVDESGDELREEL